MKFPQLKTFATGVAIPVFSLRSAESCGTGEFLDLPLLGTWCRQNSIELIQILPINDTGTDPSPYSALSAFALNPLFIRIQNIPEAADFSREVRHLRSMFEQAPRLHYFEVLEAKLDLLGKIFKASFETVMVNPDFLSFIKKNSWVKDYSVFSYLKRKNNLNGWKGWTEYQNPKAKDLSTIWESQIEETRFFAWIQFHLEAQLIEAREKLEEQGVYLKGDIPIMMNVDSADVWASREYFQMELRAGAPPDMFSALGQNWGFPIYNWDALEKNEYSWWKKRLKQADKFFHAYRIDHVLGFFRIWATPEDQFTGALGYFLPYEPITAEELRDRGFDQARLTWLSEPHIFGQEIRDNLGADSDAVISLAFTKIGNENLYRFKPEISGEKQILALDVSEHAKEVLLSWFRNRCLLKSGSDIYYPYWFFRESRAYDSLSPDEKNRFEELIWAKSGRSQAAWGEQGYKLLSFMKNATEMLVCAEDLGVIPDCVPGVLGSLKILGLKIPRWAREWNKGGQPYQNIREYPFFSVCTPSVHDTSTLRGWWDEDSSRSQFLSMIGEDPASLDQYTPEAAARVLAGLMQASSFLTIFQIQDFLALDSSYVSPKPEDERINVPGTVVPTNWSYRLPVTMEKLIEDKELTEKIKKLVSLRKRPLPHPGY